MESPAWSRTSAQPSRSSRSATRSSVSRASAPTRSTSACARSGALAHKPAGMTFEEAAAVCDGALIALVVPAQGRHSDRDAAPRLRRVRVDRDRRGAAGEAPRRPGHRRVQREERRARAVARRRRGRRLRASRTSRRTAQTYDVVFDAVGKHSFRRCRHSLEAGRSLHRDRSRFPLARAAARPRDEVGRGQARDDSGSRGTRRRTSSSSRSSSRPGSTGP